MQSAASGKEGPLPIFAAFYTKVSFTSFLISEQFVREVKCFFESVSKWVECFHGSCDPSVYTSDIRDEPPGFGALDGFFPNLLPTSFASLRIFRVRGKYGP